MFVGKGEHFPGVLIAPEYPKSETSTLGAAVLGDETEDSSAKSNSRMSYLLMLPKYQPITALTRDWDAFMSAFYALFYCHAMLWNVGIRHRHISETNLIWDPDEKKPKLCDFDISQCREPPQTGVLEKGPIRLMRLSNLGTWIFMADELLTEAAMDGLTVRRVYRHEVEAFVAVLVWIACRYQGGNLRPDPPLEHWNWGCHLVASRRRTRTYNEIASLRVYPRPSGLPTSVWDLIRRTLDSMEAHRSLLSQARSARRKFRLGRGEPPTDMPEDFDDLRALRKNILSWDLFSHPSAGPFVELIREHIHDCDEQKETKP